MVRIAGFALALLGAVSVGGARANAWQEMTLGGGGFSAEFPQIPAEIGVDLADDMPATVWMTKTDDATFLVGVTDHPRVGDAERQLAQDVDAFLHKIKGTLQTKAQLAFAGSGGERLAALRLTFLTEEGARGEAIAVMSGQRAYAAVVGALQGHEPGADVARFLQSFRLRSGSSGANGVEAAALIAIQ